MEVFSLFILLHQCWQLLLCGNIKVFLGCVSLFILRPACCVGFLPFGFQRWVVFPFSRLFCGELEVLGGKWDVERWSRAMGRRALMFQARKITATAAVGTRLTVFMGFSPVL